MCPGLHWVRQTARPIGGLYHPRTIILNIPVELDRKVNAFYTLGEEIANVVTHVIGAGLAAVGAVWLWRAADTAGERLSLGVYAVTLLVLFFASTLYHAVQDPVWRHRLRVADHSAIFLFIAGTYTPIVHMAELGRPLLIAIWTVAIAGVGLKLLFWDRYNVAFTMLYVAMGWFSFPVLRTLPDLTAPDILPLLLGGGLLFTSGVAFYLWERLRYNHAVWHLFVLGGCATHFAAIARLA